MAYLPFDLTLSTTLSNSQVQANDAALDTAISGNLTEANLSSATRIPNAMLATSNVEELIQFNFIHSVALTPGNKFNVNIHGTGTYTIVGGRYSFTCSGGTPAAGNTFQILAGNYNGTTFVTSSTLVNTTSFYTSAGNVANSADLTIATSTFTGPTTLVFPISAVSGTPPTGGLISATLRVTRSLQ